MTLSAIASRYAHALADVVTSDRSKLTPADAVSELRGFESVLKASPELRNALMSPAVPPGRKRAVVGRIAAALKLSQVSQNFLFVLIDKRRIVALSEVLNAFETIVDARLGFARAEIVSAGELSEPQRGALSAQLERLVGKRIRMRFAIDGGLIGGVVARIGSTVYDGSVRGQLAAMGRRLSAES